MQRNKHLKNVFLRFLKDNNAYFAFISNVEKNNQEGYLKDFFIKYNPERWLSSPFVWERTVQGCDFWYDLDTKWNEIVMNGQEKEDPRALAVG